MINSFQIRNIATFCEEGINFPSLKKINFIYGANGSGKTSISNYFLDPTKVSYTDCNISWKNGDDLKTLVYNKEFRDRNFGKETIAGVFTLGEATKEEKAKIELKNQELVELKEQGTKKRETLDKQKQSREDLENEFRETIWSTVYKKNEKNFKEAFTGVMQKKSFLNRLLKEFKNNTSDLREFDYLTKKAETIFGDTPEKITELTEIDFNEIQNIESLDVWQKKIIGKGDVEIAKLIQRLNINDWVNEGRNYIEDESEVCPFCQERTITDNFKKQLEEYFDQTFLTNTKEVKEQSEKYSRNFENLINELNSIETNEKSNKKSKLQIEKFSALLKTLNNQFLVNKELINNKTKEPSREINLNPTKPQLEEISKLISDANKLIKEHNQIVDNFSTEKTDLIKKVWRYLIEENKDQLENYDKKAIGLEKGISKLNDDVEDLLGKHRKLKNEIRELTKNVTSIQPSVDEINTTLKSFGFKNFEIVPSNVGVNAYQIQRENGELAESTLSEGEITFITFLYYLQLSKGSVSETNITEERVLVIDDPISSLDSNILFVVSSLIKQIIQKIKSGESNIKQLILLTHNVYFHKEVSFINGRTKECNQTNFWILRKIENRSFIQDFGMENPIQNSYELLWKEIKNKEHHSGLTIQNTMRRIIENYFKILGKYTDDSLIDKFDNPQEKEICRSLISWINEGSHTIPDDLFVELQDTTTENYLEVFEKIFKETNQIEHYNMMMQN